MQIYSGEIANLNIRKKRCFKNVKGQDLPFLEQVKKIQNIKLMKIWLYEN